MARFFTKVAALATLTLGLVGTIEAVPGSSLNYTAGGGSLCKDYVDYQVWAPPNVTIAMLEGGLINAGLNETVLGKLKATLPVCSNLFMIDTCASAFPRIDTTPIANQPNSVRVRFACKSACQSLLTECAEYFTAVGAQAYLPDCDAPIKGTSLTVPPNGILYQPDGECNIVKPLGNAGGGAASNLTITCEHPFVTDPRPNGKTANSQYCMLGCCIKCPAQYHLYREGALEKGFTITNIIRAVSMVFSFILFLSYCLLPDKRSHPSALILFFSLCVFLFSVVIVFPLIDTRSMQCFDEINPTTQKNSLKCAIQGAILIFASVSTCAWCTALIINLHLHTVWNSAWLAKKYLMLHIICWGYAIAVTGVALGLGEVRWEFATLCLVSQHKAPTIFFYPMAAMIFPAFLVHIATFAHIARISAQAGGDSETMSRSTLSAGAAAVISHRRHVMMAIRIQWRAALMAVCAILSVTFYWLFYFIQLKKINPTTLSEHIVHFVSCLKQGNAHDYCADQMAPFLPPYGLMIAAEALVSSIGTVIFIVFFKANLVREWGEWFSSIGYLCSGKRKQKKEQDQFFVI
ncbi:hypothetical protein BGZ81_000853 [Podila clonocystis]|nr:hypothetical protein BGZ81_000853 [Podila clonocystis]